MWLPDEHRARFREPLGPIYGDPAAFLAEAGAPIIAVGDMVTYHLIDAEQPPELAVVDGRTKRRAVDTSVERRVRSVEATTIEADNPAGTITVSLIEALRAGLDHSPPVQVEVSGEEDLATVPAVLLAPAGASVVYGQPDEGMVGITVTAEARAAARALLELMEGDRDTIQAALVPPEREPRDSTQSD